MSTHGVYIQEISNLRKHPNADTLSVGEINGWQVVVRTADFTEGERVVYVEPDYCVPVAEGTPFHFLASKAKGDFYRVKATKLRGVVSYGLVIKTNIDAPVGTNVMDAYGIIRYEAPVKENVQLSGDEVALPKGIVTAKFDLENFKHFPDFFHPDEIVYVTEKVHGCNARYMNIDGQIYVGSRNRWLKRPEAGEKLPVWWKVYEENYELQRLLRHNPNVMFVGEIYGPVQSLDYGKKTPDIVFFPVSYFVADGIFKQMDCWRTLDFLRDAGCSIAPILYHGEYKGYTINTEIDSILATFNGKPGQIMEGVVIQSTDPHRMGPTIHSVRALKFISERYWLSNES
jgi:RNA ligase (TIGR02306 family)